MVKRLFFYLLACLLACLLLLLLLEGVLRFIVRPDNPFLSYASARQFAAQPGIFAPGDSAFQRGPERMPFRYSVNNLGFRGSLKAQRGEKILLLGDSVAFGLFLNDTDTLAQQIQHLSQGGLTVLNSGVGGWGPEEQFAWLKDKLPMLRVDRVLWLITTNDPMDGLSGDNHYQKVKQRIQDRRGYNLWLEQTAIYAFLRTTIRQRAKKQHKKRLISVQKAESWLAANGCEHPNSHTVEFVRRFLKTDCPMLALRPDASAKAAEAGMETYLQRTHQFLQDRGIPLSIAVFPAYIQLTCPRLSRALQHQVKSFCLQTGAQYIDLLPAFAKHKNRDALYLLPRDFHPSAKGTRVMAEQIIRHMKAGPGDD